MDSYGAQILADTPLVYWRLEEGAGNLIDEIGGVPAVPAGGVSYRVPGALASGDVGVAFNGTTGVANAGALAALNFAAGSYTIEAWVKTAGGAYATLVGKSNNVTGWRAFLTPANTLALFWATDSDLYLSSQQVKITPGQWCHCLWGYDAVAGRAFYAVNGVYEAMAPEANHPVTSAAAVTLGADARPGYFYTGALDEVAVYARALTPAQITRHYVAGMTDTRETILRNKSGHALLAYDEATATLSRLARDGSYAAAVQRDGASYYWRLDEASGTTTVDQIVGNVGTISGGVTLNQPGPTPGNPAMTFDGTTGKILTTTPVSIPQTATIEAWVKTTAPGIRAVLSTRAATGSIFVGLQNGIPQAYTVVSGANGSRPVADGLWHHLAYVLDGTLVSFYVDGVLDLAAALTRVGPTAIAAAIGWENDSGGLFFWSGSLDNVAVYPIALTPAQITAHAQAGRGAFGPAVEPVLWNKSGDPVLGYLEPTDALVVLAGGGLAPAPAVLAPRTYDALIRRDAPSNYWRLDEATGLLARDSVGGAHGTISGGVTLNQQGALTDGNPAMRFDGVAGKLHTTAPVVIPLAATIEFWFRRSVAPDGVLLSSRGAGSSGDVVYVGFTGGALMLFSTAVSAGVRAFGADDRWHHVALVLTGATATFYSDGVQDGPATAQARTTPSTGPFDLARDDPNNSNFAGALDEVAVYPVALTPAQIAQHVAAGYGVFPTVEPVLRSKSGHAVLGYNEATDQLSVLCQGSL